MVGKDRTERSNAAEGNLGDGREHVGKFIIDLGKIVLHKDEFLLGGDGAGNLLSVYVVRIVHIKFIAAGFFFAVQDGEKPVVEGVNIGVGRASQVLRKVG